MTPAIVHAFSLSVMHTYHILKYSLLYENDHFNQAQAEFKKVLNGQSKQAQAEFKKVLNGQSKHAAQKKRGKKEEEKGSETGSSMVHTLQKIDHLR